MKFTKMHGCGNDYVYVDCTKNKLSDPQKVARFVSDRHFGIGGDGLILIQSSDIADFEMAMYNADGSRGEMCGNGIRCVGKFVYDKGLTDKETITIETLAGIKTLELTTKDNQAVQVRVNMGSPRLLAKEVPAIYSEEKMIDAPLLVDGKEYKVNAISMGNPHCVIFTKEDVRELDLQTIGPKFEKHPAFPNKINTEFINVLDDTHLRMRVWERGSGETLACGTGACASVVAAILCHHTKDCVDVELLGGHLTIEYDRNEDIVYMTGPATTVFEGEISDIG